MQSSQPDSTQKNLDMLAICMMGILMAGLTLAAAPRVVEPRLLPPAVIFTIMLVACLRQGIRLSPGHSYHLGTIFMFAAVLLFPPVVTLVVVGVSTLLGLPYRNYSGFKRIFNFCHRLLYVSAGCLVLIGLGQSPWQPGALPAWLGAALAALVMLILNVTLVARVTSRKKARPYRLELVETLRSMLLFELGLYMIGLLTALVIWAYLPSVILVTAAAAMALLVLNQIGRRIEEQLVLSQQVSSVNADLAREVAYKQEAVEKLHEAANHLQVSEDRYRSLFEDSPISLWEEDFSAFKAYLDGVRAGGVTDFQTYFETHLEDLIAAQSQIIVRAVNRCTLEMYHAPSMAALIANQEAIFAPFSSHLLIQEATAIANGAQSFEVEGLNRDFDGGWLDVQMKWTVIPGYEADLSRIIVAIRDITAIKSRERELETVANVSAVLRGALTRASLLPLVLDQLSELLNTPSMAIGLIGADKHEVEFGIARGNWVRLMGARLPFTPELASPQIVTDPVDARSGHETRQMHVSLDLRSEPGCGLVPYIDDDFSAVAAPLAAQGQTVGILWIGKAEAFKASDLRLIGIVADIAANAIHRLSLFEAIQLYGQQMAIISAAGRALSQTLEQPRQYVQAVETVFKLIPNVQRALLALYDPETQYLTYLRGEDAAGKYWTDDFQVALNRPYSPPGATAAVRDKQPVITNEVINKPGAGTQSTRLYSVMYVPMVAKDRVVGILQIEGKRENQFTAGDAEILMLFGNTTAVTIENARLFNDLDRMNQDLIESYDTTLEGWCRALDLRDEETEGHSQRVVALTLKLATAMGLNEALLVHLRRGALLHDIGKMGIPDAILKKKGPLDESEWRIMRQHPQHAYNMLAPIPYLRPALEIPLYHHEHYDGSGYPFGLRGDRIPLAARIFAVVDVWDALLADRPYRARWSPDRVVAYLREEAGRHFDPQVVETFLEIVAGQSET